MQITRVLFSLALAFVVTATCVAQDADKKKGKKATDRAIKNTTSQMMKAFAKVELTEEQQAKAKAIIEKHIGSLIEARKAQDGILTDDQKKARTEAIAKAKEDGTKGAKLAAVGTKAMGLSKEDAKKYSDAKKKVTATTAKIKGAIMELLTDEQKAAMPKRGKGKKGKKKKDGADKTQTVSLKLPGMTCGGCAASVRAALVTVDGIENIKTDPATNSCTFTAPAKLDVKATLDKFAAGGNKHIEGWKHAKGKAL